jgi:hypothetical protein
MHPRHCLAATHRGEIMTTTKPNPMFLSPKPTPPRQKIVYSYIAYSQAAKDVRSLPTAISSTLGDLRTKQSKGRELPVGTSGTGVNFEAQAELEPSPILASKFHDE